ncbi:MAG: peptidylprolyl isomerase [Bacilli bacterium]|nr:peptidylprolyl isomerase [Bacilli bacterium]
MFKKLGILLICLLFIGGCTEAKLIDGEEAIVTFNEKEDEGITAEELYSKLKEVYGINHLVDMIDTYLLEKEYEETDEEKNYVNQILSSIKDSAKTNNYNYEDYIKATYGVANEKGLKEYISLNYKRSKYTEDYAKTLVTDKQINEYYEKYTIGDIEASHILITADVDSNATDEEKTKAEEAAKKTAEEIIKKLDAGEDFATLAKEYSDDTGSAENGGELGYFNRGVMDEAFEEAAVALEKGKYSKTPVKSSFGYHIIYKTNQKDKPSLKDAKETIIETISKELIETDSTTIYFDALKDLREKNKLNFVDSDLKNDYDEYLNN